MVSLIAPTTAKPLYFPKSFRTLLFVPVSVIAGHAIAKCTRSLRPFSVSCGKIALIYPTIPNPNQLLASGFLPTRGSIMLDFLFVAILVIAAVLTLSIYLAGRHKKYALHKQIQIALSLIVLITIVAFEIDVRFFTDWRALAEPSTFYESGWVDIVLWIHLCFAIPTPFVWLYTVVMAARNFPKDPKPANYSRKHRFWGRVSAALLYLTVITGCVFYVVSFVA